MARPKLKIDSEQVLKLAEMQCTNVEIAAFFDCDESTIRVRFSDIVAKGRERGKISLRRAQMKTALNGNATLLIWLGKQYLGQKDQEDNRIDDVEGYFKKIADAISKSDTNSD